jgi:hypothetical protein
MLWPKRSSVRSSTASRRSSALKSGVIDPEIHRIADAFHPGSGRVTGDADRPTACTSRGRRAIAFIGRPPRRAILRRRRDSASLMPPRGRARLRWARGHRPLVVAREVTLGGIPFGSRRSVSKLSSRTRLSTWTGYEPRLPHRYQALHER